MEKKMIETKVKCPVCQSEFMIAQYQHIVQGMCIGEDSGLGTVYLPVKNEGVCPECGGGSASAGGSGSAGSAPGTQIGGGVVQSGAVSASTGNPYGPRNGAAARLHMFAKAGLDVTKYGIATKRGGDAIITKYDEEGMPVVVDERELDDIDRKIQKYGHIRNPRLQRRNIMAQYFRGEEHGAQRRWNTGEWNDETNSWVVTGVKYNGDKGKCKDGQHFVDWIRSHGSWYQFTVIKKELEAQMKMRMNGDKKNLSIRSYYSKGLCVALAEWAYKIIETNINKLPVNGRGFRKVAKLGKVKEDEIMEKLYAPMRKAIAGINNVNDGDIVGLHMAWCELMTSMVVPLKTGKFCSQWMSVYKGVGAYYVMLNLITAHECTFFRENGEALSRMESMIYLDKLYFEYMDNGNGHYMLGVLRQFVKDNRFDFYEKMSQLYK